MTEIFLHKNNNKTKGHSKNLLNTFYAIIHCKEEISTCTLTAPLGNKMSEAGAQLLSYILFAMCRICDRYYTSGVHLYLWGTFSNKKL